MTAESRTKRCRNYPTKKTQIVTLRTLQPAKQRESAETPLEETYDPDRTQQQSTIWGKFSERQRRSPVAEPMAEIEDAQERSDGSLATANKALISASI